MLHYVTYLQLRILALKTVNILRACLRVLYTCVNITTLMLVNTTVVLVNTTVKFLFLLVYATVLACVFCIIITLKS